MNTKFGIEWIYAAGIRAIKTMAQTAVSMITVGQAMSEIKWQYVLSVSLVAGIYSICTSIATNLPEVGSDGTLHIDTSDSSNYKVELNSNVDSSKKVVKLNINQNGTNTKS